jgi:hypothetical protein
VKKLAVIAVFAALALGGCVCKAEKQVVSEIEKTQAIMDAEYLKYVEADPLLKPDDKTDRKKLVESRSRLLEKLKKSLE